MRLSFWPWPTQPWRDLVAIAQHVERTGWDGIWFADHFMPSYGDPGAPWLEAWTTLAALAQAVPRVRLGPLVTGNTYRHPAVLAKMAVTVDHISGGRLVLGLGSGWQENEHQAYGIPFYTTGERLRRLEEACAVISAMNREPRASFAGVHYQLTDAPAEPKPVQRPLPLLIGGGGEKVTLRIAARYADEWNVWGDVATLRHKMAVLDQHCRALGRDPRAIQRSAVAMLVLAENERAAAEASQRPSPMPRNVGTVEQMRETLRAYQAAGVDELIVPDLFLPSGPAKLELLDRFITEVAPAVR